MNGCIDFCTSLQNIIIPDRILEFCFEMFRLIFWSEARLNLVGNINRKLFAAWEVWENYLQTCNTANPIPPQNRIQVWENYKPAILQIQFLRRTEYRCEKIINLQYCKSNSSADPNTVPEFIDPVFSKTSPKRSFSVIQQNERFRLVFAKTGSIISGTGVRKL